MDTAQILADLRAQRDRITAAIDALEAMRRTFRLLGQGHFQSRHNLCGERRE